ncbi:MAG: hypothetical protein ACOZCL_14100 [Bacillota bacterium]
MGTNKKYMKEFESFCINENLLEELKSKKQTQINHYKHMHWLNQLKNEQDIKARYDRNIKEAHELLENVRIYHNTGLESLLSILKEEALLSIAGLEKIDASFSYRVTSRGIEEEMHKYVFAYPFEGNIFNGLYEIELDKSVEQLENAFFMPSGWLNYESFLIGSHIMDLKDWKGYMAEYISVNFEEPADYFRNTPKHLKPEFLFADKLPTGCIRAIRCLSELSYKALVAAIKEEFGDNHEYLKLVSYLDEVEV